MRFVLGRRCPMSTVDPQTPRWAWTNREPIRATLLRTGTIAIVLGLIISLETHRSLSQWPFNTLLALWPALGGHFVELFFLNCLRPRLPTSRAAQILVRLITWYLGGLLLGAGVYATIVLLHGNVRMHAISWWMWSFVFIAIELIAHLVMQLRGVGSVYDGRS